MCRAITMTIAKRVSPISRKPTLLKKRHRSVRFSAPTTNPALNNSILTQEEIENQWYSKVDEKLFKQDAVNALREYRRKAFLNKQTNNHNNPNSKIEYFPRGLERHTRERRDHKKETIRLVVLAHKSGFKPEEVALFAQQRSTWNVELAATQAHIDQIEVLLKE